MNLRELIKELRLKREAGIVSIDKEEILIGEEAPKVVDKPVAAPVKTTKKRGKRT